MTNRSGATFDIQRQVNFYVCLSFALAVLAIAWTSTLLTTKAITISTTFSIGLLGYIAVYRMGATPNWTEQVVGLVAAVALVYLSLFSEPNYATVVVFVVAPAFAFLCYSFLAGLVWSSILLMILAYALFYSDLVPQAVVPEGIRRGVLAAYVFQMVISTVASVVKSWYNSQLALANTKIKQLESVLPVCMDCRSIRDGEDWFAMETYLAKTLDRPVSHGFCPSCADMRLRELRDL